MSELLSASVEPTFAGDVPALYLNDVVTLIAGLDSRIGELRPGPSPGHPHRDTYTCSERSCGTCVCTETLF
jgi:hypothetical protein